MKKFVVSLVSVVTLLVPTQVLAQDWVKVNEGIIIDADSIFVNASNPNIRFYWKRFQWNHPGYVMRYRIANCATGHTNVLKEVVYNNVGEIVSRKSIEDRGEDVRPHSMGSGVLNIVCQ